MCRAIEKGAMGRDWKESKENRVVLPDVQDGLFETYLQWMNTATIAARSPSCMLYFTRLYMLGNFLDDTGFRDAVLDDIANAAYEMRPCLSTVKVVWDNKPGSSPLKELMLEIWAKWPTWMAVEDLRRHADECLSDFVADYIEHMLLTGRIGTTPSCCKHKFIKELQEFRRGL
jgi:hypothetical protein